MIAVDARPRLARGVRLRADPVRGGFNLLAPERVLRANDSSAAVLGLCDGERSLGEIIDILAERYDVERDRIESEATTLLEDLMLKRMVEL
jgi:pyrroloquinoline quinone biosynthesis protein D